MKYREKQALDYMTSLCDRYTAEGRRQCITRGCPMARFWCFEDFSPMRLYMRGNRKAKEKILRVLYKAMEAEGYEV